uniref:Uncharacterized protein n=1 Tax=Leersia perrieri TaxID=77586 RepID=A0A0D9W7C9_9ORYZ
MTTAGLSSSLSSVFRPGTDVFGGVSGEELKMKRDGGGPPLALLARPCARARRRWARGRRRGPGDSGAAASSAAAWAGSGVCVHICALRGCNDVGVGASGQLRRRVGAGSNDPACGGGYAGCGQCAAAGTRAAAVHARAHTGHGGAGAEAALAVRPVVPGGCATMAGAVRSVMGVPRSSRPAAISFTTSGRLGSGLPMAVLVVRGWRRVGVKAVSCLAWSKKRAGYP